jgi:hypothetical protein
MALLPQVTSNGYLILDIFALKSFLFHIPTSRYTKEQQEQRDIADQQEELLLKDSSARFLNRRPNSPEFAATIIAGSSKDPRFKFDQHL